MRLPLPQPQRRDQIGPRPSRVASGQSTRTLGGEPLEALRVDPIRPDAQLVAAGSGAQFLPSGA